MEKIALMRYPIGYADEMLKRADTCDELVNAAIHYEIHLKDVGIEVFARKGNIIACEKCCYMFCFESDLEGIPLTYSNLNNGSFKKQNDLWTDGKYEIAESDGKFYGMNKEGERRELKFIHELQQIYVKTVGEKLNIHP